MTTFYYSPRALQRRRLNEGIHIPINVSANDDVFQITALVPGINSDDLEIEVLEDRIDISGEFVYPSEEEGLRELRQELPFGSFHRSIRLRSQLNADKAEAVVKDGVLTLTVPKAEHAKTRKIAINAK